MFRGNVQSATQVGRPILLISFFVLSMNCALLNIHYIYLIYWQLVFV